MPKFCLAVYSGPSIFVPQLLLKMKLEGGLCSNKVSYPFQTFCQETVHFHENVGVLLVMFFPDRNNLVINKAFESILLIFFY